MSERCGRNFARRATPSSPPGMRSARKRTSAARAKERELEDVVVGSNG
jgi:hypothetical protein